MSSPDVVNIVIAVAVVGSLVIAAVPGAARTPTIRVIQRFILLRRVAQQEAAGQVPAVDPRVSA